MGMNGGGFRGPRGPGMGMGPMGGGMGGNAPGPGGLLSGIMGAAGGFKAEGKEDGARRRSDVDATTFKGGKLKGFFLFRLLKKLYYCFGLHKLWVKICVKFFQLKRCAKFAFARLVKALPCLIFEFIFDLIALSVIVCLCKVIKPSLPSHPDDDPDADTDDAGMDASAKVFTSQFKHSPPVWIVMWSEPLMFMPLNGCAGPNSFRAAMSPGISCSASVSSFRPNSAKPRSFTFESAIATEASECARGKNWSHTS